MTKKEILQQLISQIATCWTPAPTGRFDAERAEMLLVEALKLLKKEKE